VYRSPTTDCDQDWGRVWARPPSIVTIWCAQLVHNRPQKKLHLPQAILAVDLPTAHAVGDPREIGPAQTAVVQFTHFFHPRK
jgi:hypothetical protein